MFDFGVSMKFNTKSRMLSTKTIKGGTEPYLSPEVINNRQGRPSAIDVYGWGMTLLHLASGKTPEQFEELARFRPLSYSAFLENVQKLKLKNDTNGHLTKKIIEILQKVLSNKPEDRPTFEKLLTMLPNEKLYKDEAQKLNTSLSAITRERGKINKNSR